MNISDDKNMHMPTDAEIATNIHKILHGDESIPRLIFYLQETRNRYQHSGGYNYFIAEYIIPKPSKASEANYPSHEDDALEQERKTRIKTIGNFLLLGKPRIADNPEKEIDEQEKMLRTLKKVTNEQFDTKSKVMKQYLSSLVCSNWFITKNSWTENDVNERNTGFANMVVPTLWPIE